MENRSISLAGVMVHNGTSHSRERFKETFSVSGFGAGDHKSPTVGTFDKVTTTHMNGHISWGQANANTGVYYLYGDITGVLYPSYSGAVESGLCEANGAVARNKAIKNFYTRLTGEQQSLLAEIAEAVKGSHIVSGLGQVAENLATSLDAYGLQRSSLEKKFKGEIDDVWAQPFSHRKKLKLRRAIQFKRVRAMASAWLAFRYGVQASVNGLNELSQWKSPNYSKKVVGTGFAHESFSKEFFNEEHNIRYRFESTVTGVNPLAAMAASLGLVNPFSTALELIPMSFVADWFINVSGLLRSFENSFLIGVTVSPIGQTITSKRVSVSDAAIDYKSVVRPDGWYDWNKWFGTGKRVHVHKERSITPAPIETLTFSTSPIKLGSARLASAAALFAQRAF